MFQLHPPKEFVLSYIEQRISYKRKLDKKNNGGQDFWVDYDKELINFINTKILRLIII
jgi:hypothetical protein